MKKQQRRHRLFLSVMAILAAAAGARAERPIDFNRDIRPILSNKCFFCHGPDDGKRQAGLRLDGPKIATSKLESGVVAIVPGKPADSELVRRITSADNDERMPPADSGKSLDADEIAKLRQWIAEGAKFATHWS